MDELIRRVDVARPLLEKYREVKRQAERGSESEEPGLLSCIPVRYGDFESVHPDCR